MKRIKLIFASLLLTAAITAQQKPQQWNLRSCIDYALTNNIQVKQSLITYKSGIEDTKQAKAQFTPTLSA
ncbi:MAG TPA: TolC family protein, partial [Bacteroidales bacterium]